MDEIPERFPRLAGQVPRAAVACYAAAILHAATAASAGLIGGSAREISIGFITAFFGAVLWVAIGTGLALLAQIADRR
jgi:hypothetical protein